MASFIDAMVQSLAKKGMEGTVTSVKELRENQYGIPLKHYAQQYLFGATGLRIHVFNSIAGSPGSCKSSLLFDLMGDVAAPVEDGGLGGFAMVCELEGKISPQTFNSILRGHTLNTENVTILKDMTLEQAIVAVNQSLTVYKSICPKKDKPMLIGLDSIGGASSADTIEKMSEGKAGKGYYDKAHYMKYFCENMGTILAKENIPVVIVCINQEKEVQSQTYGPPSKRVTGGISQVFKEGHMISASAVKLNSGTGNRVILKTTKTSFCDPRKIEVIFRWNKFGLDSDDPYQLRFDWALASAMCLAEPTAGVGDLRDIIDVKVSTQELVTCPQLGLKSVVPTEFEAALMANTDLLQQLYTYQKIEQLRSVLDAQPEEQSEESATEDKPKRGRRKA